jgi:alpha-tubulin suppressor-like RCC1 family protein
VSAPVAPARHEAQAVSGSRGPHGPRVAATIFRMPPLWESLPDVLFEVPWFDLFLSPVVEPQGSLDYTAWDTSPVESVSPSFLEVAPGRTHVCARSSDRRVYCWGANEFGQVGDGTRIDRATATAVLGLGAVTRIGAGDDFTCALREDQTVWCWGHNQGGQLGDGTLLDRDVPVQVYGIKDVQQIAVGADRTCAKLGDGTEKCWGAR